MGVRRAPRCPISGFGWLYCTDQDHNFLEKGGPPMTDPTGKVSGQSADYVRWGTAQVAKIVKNDPWYQQQIAEQIRVVERELSIAQASVNSAQSDRDRIQATLDGIKELLDP